MKVDPTILNLKMKFVLVLFAIIASLFGFAYGEICATDLRSGRPQNFRDHGRLQAENGRGGSKFRQIS